VKERKDKGEMGNEEKEVMEYEREGSERERRARKE
jgi:hypothetical protein